MKEGTYAQSATSDMFCGNGFTFYIICLGKGDLISLAKTIGGQLSEDAFKLFLRSIGIEVGFSEIFGALAVCLHCIKSPILYMHVARFHKRYGSQNGSKPTTSIRQ